jgi:hypothetical protein
VTIQHPALRRKVILVSFFMGGGGGNASHDVGNKGTFHTVVERCLPMKRLLVGGECV